MSRMMEKQRLSVSTVATSAPASPPLDDDARRVEDAFPNTQGEGKSSLKRSKCCASISVPCTGAPADHGRQSPAAALQPSSPKQHGTKRKELASPLLKEPTSKAPRKAFSKEPAELEVQVNDSPRVCELCCYTATASDAVRLECGHGWYCRSCVRRHAEAQLDVGAVTMSCPQCAKVLAERNVRQLLPAELCDRFLQLSLERAVLSTSDLRACPTPDCPMRVALEPGAEPRLKCNMCNRTSCLLCGAQPYHRGRTCEEHAAKPRARRSVATDQALFRKWMDQTGTKQCPTCRMAISKQNLNAQGTQRRECHKMICRNCGTRFCFKCSAVLTEAFTCGCTQAAHGFLDPVTGEHLPHLRVRPRGKAAGSAGERQTRPRGGK